MSNILEDLRKPKINVGGMELAVFDLSTTVIGGYALASYMDWSKPKTITGMFILGYLAHEITGTKTPLNTKINDAIYLRPETITLDSLPINNDPSPVRENEIRYSTM